MAAFTTTRAGLTFLKRNTDIKLSHSPAKTDSDNFELCYRSPIPKDCRFILVDKVRRVVFLLCRALPLGARFHWITRQLLSYCGLR